MSVSLTRPGCQLTWRRQDAGTTAESTPGSVYRHPEPAGTHVAAGACGGAAATGAGVGAGAGAVVATVRVTVRVTVALPAAGAGARAVVEAGWLVSISV